MAVPQLPLDWSYLLAEAFLDAAVSCLPEGVTCDRRFVSDGSYVEQPPPSSVCSCQLVAVLAEGFEPLPSAGALPPAVCGARRVVEVRLVLDLCTVAPPDQTHVPDPAKVNAQARMNASIRWAMQVGLRRAWAQGALSAIGESLGPLAATLHERIRPGSWRPTRSTGGAARWEAVWRFEDDG